jgi:glycine/D-amino acid oxidase-like deaminating enzyme
MHVAVLGGGLQGACVAMELASAGISVDLYDRNDRFMSQASAHNEGKIHLGYTYANDRSLCTARTMVKGGITFASLMRRWIGDAIDRIPLSTPFHYVVHTESLLSIDEVERHFRSSHAIALEESRHIPLDYFGADYRMPPARMSESECGSLFDRQRVAAAYRTAEMSIDPEALAATVRTSLAANPKIQCFLQAHVHGVTLNDDGATVDFEMSGSRAREQYDHVVNALWDGRLAVDKTVGLQPERPWLYRVKHYLKVQASSVASTLPSTTIVLGAFGDVVVYGDGTLYLSWYPAGMRGASSDLSPPAWSLVLDEPASIEMREKILDGLRGIVPAIGRLTPDTVECCRVNAGIIVAWGETDICDPASGLHQRHAIGPRSYGRYHTVDTGKLTMAPFFGKMVADRIRQTGREP